MFSLSLFVSFLLSLAICSTLAIPTGSEALSSLAPRTLYCANAPSVEAGTLFSRDLPQQLPPATLSKRAQTQPYCAKLSKTYVTANLVTLFTPSTGVPAMAVADLLIETEKFLAHYVATMGDRNLSGGRFEWPGNEGLLFRVWSANNHQLTYGVLAAAAQALQVWAWGEGWGAIKFKIYDGANWVGEGFLQVFKSGG